MHINLKNNLIFLIYLIKNKFHILTEIILNNYFIYQNEYN